MPDREMVMPKQYKGIDNISADDHELVLECFTQWQQNRQRPNREHIKTLFDKYHEYVYKSPSDISCSSCVQFIFDYWKQVTETWKTNKPITNN
ncbi:hypothetical protein BH09BAC1_BH09BAC1_16350 [soil metagenome]